MEPVTVVISASENRQLRDRAEIGFIYLCAKLRTRCLKKRLQTLCRKCWKHLPLSSLTVQEQKAWQAEQQHLKGTVFWSIQHFVQCEKCLLKYFLYDHETVNICPETIKHLMMQSNQNLNESHFRLKLFQQPARVILISTLHVISQTESHPSYQVTNTTGWCSVFKIKIH